MKREQYIGLGVTLQTRHVFRQLSVDTNKSIAVLAAEAAMLLRDKYADEQAKDGAPKALTAA